MTTVDIPSQSFPRRDTCFVNDSNMLVLHDRETGKEIFVYAKSIASIHEIPVRDNSPGLGKIIPGVFSHACVIAGGRHYSVQEYSATISEAQNRASLRIQSEQKQIKERTRDVMRRLEELEGKIGLLAPGTTIHLEGRLVAQNPDPKS